jgi:NAD(P)-dependent dehydrogenase (short-subunit alcohol dehydrogenase family)
VTPQLEGTRVVVTGGSSGIGASVVATFVGEGAAVISLGTNEERGREVVRSANGPGTADFVRCDVRSRDAVRSTFAAAAATLGGVDALVHAAGVRTEAPAEQLSDEDYDLVMETNVRGTFLTNQEVFPHLRDSGGGRIVNFASGAALYPYLNAAHYSASKAAVIAWTRTIAHEWGRHGISANAVNPAMWTPLYEAKRAHMSADDLAAHDAAMAARIPLGGTLGDPARDLGPVLVFLLSDAARFITGQIISVDGGMVPLR